MPSRANIASRSACWKQAGKVSSAGVSASASAIGAQREGELDQVPVDRLGLAAEGIEAGMVEIGGGEMRRPNTASSATGRNRSSRAVIAILSELSTPWTKPAAI